MDSLNWRNKAKSLGRLRPLQVEGQSAREERALETCGGSPLSTQQRSISTYIQGNYHRSWKEPPKRRARNSMYFHQPDWKTSWVLSIRKLLIQQRIVNPRQHCCGPACQILKARLRRVFNLTASQKKAQEFKNPAPKVKSQHVTSNQR